LTASTESRIPAAEILGHPRGLAVLFASEMWERFSYFGNSALVVLYMVKHLLQPGTVEGVLGYGAVKGALEAVFGPLDVQPFASQLFGLYTGFAYFTPVLGGYIADRWLGQHRTVIFGGICMAIGHFMIAFEGLFFIALAMLILGIGTFKPNISTQVGALYALGDHRRDRGYSIFYVGINIGAFLAPLVCGTLAAAWGWHAGFAAAGIGMLISLGIYLGGSRALPPERPRSRALARAATPLTNDERRAVVALLLVCAPVSLFWATYDQQFNTMLLWIDDFTARTIDLGFWQGEIPTPWFLSLNPLLIFVCAPLIVRLWAWQTQRGSEPSSVRKMAYGCLCVALANLVMVGAAADAASGVKASAFWLLGYFMLVTIGELYLAPVGLALISKVAPPRIRAMMMGCWFAATLPGDILGGYLGGFWSTLDKGHFYLMIAVLAALAGAAIWMLSSALKTIFGE
jgi:proton-dependent oligopeptide transporter, POT family